MKRRRKRKMKNNYSVKLAKNGYSLSYKMKTYLKIGVNEIYA
jgi:hypothetical protein